MKFVRGGITRFVILTRRHAIKLPRVRYGWRYFIQGLYCNMSEAECWQITKSDHLCPVLFSFAGFILVMPRVRVLTRDSELPPIDDPGADFHAANYGYYQDRVVCIDYPYHRIKPYLRDPVVREFPDFHAHECP